MSWEDTHKNHDSSPFRPLESVDVGAEVYVILPTQVPFLRIVGIVVDVWTGVNGLGGGGGQGNIQMVGDGGVGGRDGGEWRILLFLGM